MAFHCRDAGSGRTRSPGPNVEHGAHLSGLEGGCGGFSSSLPSRLPPGEGGGQFHEGPGFCSRAARGAHSPQGSPRRGRAQANAEANRESTSSGRHNRGGAPFANAPVGRTILAMCPGNLGVVMQQARGVSRGHLCRPVWLAIGLAVLASGCVSTSASGYGGGFALSYAECDQTDSTVTCCLKQNPGQYERCGAVAPTTTQSQPNNLLPGRTESEAAPIPELPTEEEKERWRTDICLPRYEKCMNAGGGSIPGRKKGETQCQACYDACMRHGYWPLRANEKPCPGA